MTKGLIPFNVGSYSMYTLALHILPILEASIELSSESSTASLLTLFICFYIIKYFAIQGSLGVGNRAGSHWDPYLVSRMAVSCMEY
jgi:hypothetical protein